MGQNKEVPVIAIDGQTGTGKTTVRGEIARRLGFREHDSGALFRAIALLAKEGGVTNEDGCAEIAARLKIRAQGEIVELDGVDRTTDIRSNECGSLAARVARMGKVHERLRQLQINLRQMPGLVADGRDMCFIYDTPHRFVLTTDSRVRARRRVAQMERLGQPADFEAILRSIVDRDKADIERKVNPFKIHSDAMVIDTSASTVAEVASIIINAYRETTGVINRAKAQTVHTT